MTTSGDRLREARLSTGLSQSAFAEVGGVQKGAQIKYESGERAPDATYLAAVARLGVDVRYVITGERDYTPQPALALSADEQRLLALYRLAEPAVRKAVVGALAVGEAPRAAAGSPQVHVAPGANVGALMHSVGSVGELKAVVKAPRAPSKRKLPDDKG